MKHTFTIEAEDSLGVLERILRVIRHRGGNITAMTMQKNSDNTLTLKLDLITERTTDSIKTQIIKLVDVKSVDVNSI